MDGRAIGDAIAASIAAAVIITAVVTALVIFGGMWLWNHVSIAVSWSW